MAQDDLAAVKAEIKAWERSFQGKHERAPTVEDIRKNAHIESKYKLYKKLSKAAASNATRESSSTTPPRNTGRASSVLSKSRVLETIVPLSSFNPFSPQKDKGKQKASQKPTNVPLTPANPFATPTKIKPKPRIREPFPSPVHEEPVVIPTNAHAEPPSAVTRARKRLRGEPVSPSPNKDKRRRVMTRRDSHDSDSDDDEEAAGDTSFIADSPIKGSSFKALFEDASGSAKVKAALTRAKSVSVATGLFGPIRGQSVPFEDDLDSVLGPGSGKPKPRLKATVNLTSKLVPRKDDLHSTKDAALHSDTNPPQAEPRISGKRLLPDSESESEQPTGNSSTLAPVLIPPSPPPKESSSQRPLDVHNKGKGKATSRKKTKFGSDGEDTDSLSDDVKVIPHESRLARAAATGTEDDESDFGPEFDPLFHYQRRSVDIHGEKRASHSFEVDLPDKLKHVLALSPSEIKLQDKQEEHVAESLIYGRRATHYDPAKGGEIWDVGDVENLDSSEQRGAQRAVVEDDDWEGEPVPWEVGEL